MNIVVGGSYHNPNWDEVKKTISQLERAGHTIIAPGKEWEPIVLDEGITTSKSGLKRIDPHEEFIRFEGERDIPREILQSMFYKRIFSGADAFVVVDKDGYLGKTVTMETIAATVVNISDRRELPVFFTEQPTILKVFNQGEYAYPEGLRKLLADSDDALLKKRSFGISANDLQIRFLGPDEAYNELKKSGMKITQEEYDLLYPFHYELYKCMIKYPLIYNVGLSQLLELEDRGESCGDHRGAIIDSSDDER